MRSGWGKCPVRATASPARGRARIGEVEPGWPGAAGAGWSGPGADGMRGREVEGRYLGRDGLSLRRVVQSLEGGCGRVGGSVRSGRRQARQVAGRGSGRSNRGWPGAAGAGWSGPGADGMRGRGVEGRYLGRDGLSLRRVVQSLEGGCGRVGEVFGQGHGKPGKWQGADREVKPGVAGRGRSREGRTGSQRQVDRVGMGPSFWLCQLVVVHWRPWPRGWQRSAREECPCGARVWPQGGRAEIGAVNAGMVTCERGRAGRGGCRRGVWRGVICPSFRRCR